MGRGLLGEGTAPRCWGTEMVREGLGEQGRGGRDDQRHEGTACFELQPLASELAGGWRDGNHTASTGHEAAANRRLRSGALPIDAERAHRRG
jgi:hypothetical protein